MKRLFCFTKQPFTFFSTTEKDQDDCKISVECCKILPKKQGVKHLKIMTYKFQLLRWHYLKFYTR